MIKAWIFEQMNLSVDESPLLFDAAACTREYAWRLELSVLAESLGFRGVFFSEHHFSGIRLCPAPNLFVAAVASRTKRLRLGVLGIVLPLCQPWRAAEEIGTLDQISGGRLEIGLAKGSNTQEAISIGIAAADIESRYQEAADILDLALREPILSYHGRHWSFEGLAILPRTIQRPPPRWAAVRSIESAVAAARRGYRPCTGFLPLEQVKELFDAYREVCVVQGKRIGPDHFGLRRCVFVSRSAARAQAQVMAAHQALPGLRAPDIIAGTPQFVAEEIIRQLGFAGCANIIAVFSGSWQDRAALQESYELFGREVIPILERVTLPGQTQQKNLAIDFYEGIPT